jgi:hypothetical protein
MCLAFVGIASRQHRCGRRARTSPLRPEPGSEVELSTAFIVFICSGWVYAPYDCGCFVHQAAFCSFGFGGRFLRPAAAINYMHKLNVSSCLSCPIDRPQPHVSLVSRSHQSYAFNLHANVHVRQRFHHHQRSNRTARCIEISSICFAKGRDVCGVY